MPHGVYPPGFDRFRKWRLVREFVQKRRLSFFRTPRAGGLHCGKFESFAQARAWLPKSPEFDNASISDEYIHDRTRRIFPFDYPTLFWLREAFEAGATSVFDIGGSVGSQYYAYQQYLTLPEGIRWRVSELPVVCRLGRELAAREGARAIEFTDSLDTSSTDEDVWMAAGVLEFFESTPLPDLLSRARRKPSHVLLNKLPLCEGEAFVSTQNVGSGSYVPHHVFNRRQFISAVEACGYVLKDAWAVPERVFEDPLNPERNFDEYSGLYFRRT